MALGLNTSTQGDFLPIAVFDARAGRMFKVERTQGPGGWESERVDITNPAPSFAFDMGSLTVGWIHFAATGPSFEMVPLGNALPAKPTTDHKQGFRGKIGGKILGGVREFSHSAKCVLGAIDALHTMYEAAPEAAAGQIPIVRMAGVIPVVTKGPQGNTTNYAPTFEIIGWAPRDETLFGPRTVPPPAARAAAPAQAPVQHQAPAGHVPPPAQAAKQLEDAGMPF